MKKILCLFSALAAAALLSACDGASTPQPAVESQTVTQDAKLKKGPAVVFLEGPAWRDDGTLLFTDIPNNKIMGWKSGGPPYIHRTPAGMANGLIFDGAGNLIIAETAGRIVRETPDGKIDVLAESFDGMKFNAPNDLTIDSQGRIYFTDTRYRNPAGATMKTADGAIINAVYRIDPNGSVTRILNTEVTKPNGILVSPGNEYLYVADNDSSKGGKRTLVRFTLDLSGNIVPDSKKELYDWGTDRGPDGMTIDVDGNIYVTAGLNHALPGKTNIKHKAGIYVFSTKGERTNYIPVPMDSTSNVTFGGKGFDTLYITGGHTIWMYNVGIKGYRAH